MKTIKFLQHRKQEILRIPVKERTPKEKSEVHFIKDAILYLENGFSKATLEQLLIKYNDQIDMLDQRFEKVKKLYSTGQTLDEKRKEHEWLYGYDKIKKKIKILNYILND